MYTGTVHGFKPGSHSGEYSPSTLRIYTCRHSFVQRLQLPPPRTTTMLWNAFLSAISLAITASASSTICPSFGSAADSLQTTFGLNATSVNDGTTLPLVATIVETQLRVSWLILSAVRRPPYPLVTEYSSNRTHRGFLAVTQYSV